LRQILAKEEHRLPVPMDLSDDGSKPERKVGCVCIPGVCRVARASIQPDRTVSNVCRCPVIGGDHFHNAPGAPHAFLPKAGQAIPDNWETAFIAITPGNLREDACPISEPTKAGNRRVAGRNAPAGA
jgi:hypothetical protein